VARLRRLLWQPPRPHGQQPPERIVGPLELFYDLVVVVLIGQALCARAHQPCISLRHENRRQHDEQCEQHQCGGSEHPAVGTIHTSLAFIAVRSGGAHTPDNVKAAHRWCNSVKRDQPLEDVA
jgi:hypothetical protein